MVSHSIPEPCANANRHLPVLCDAAITALAPRDGGLYLDGTFGGGGYTQAILAAANCRVIAIDRDPSSRERAAVLAAKSNGRLRFICGNFADLDAHAAHCAAEAADGSEETDRLEKISKIALLDGITLDLGLSSLQLDDAARGFSFRFDGPLDMRMAGPAAGGVCAADLVNQMAEAELADVLFRLGGERRSRRIARAIVTARAEAPITTTGRLATVIRAVMPPKGKAGQRIDPATRSFQALRLAVNDELGALDRALYAAERVLVPGGRLAITTFHSLEDRAVKQFLQQRAKAQPNPSRHLPTATTAGQAPSFRLLPCNGTTPDAAECVRNPRARSARLRAAARTAAPVQTTTQPFIQPPMM